MTLGNGGPPITDLVLFPHCDLHLALDHLPLFIKVFDRTVDGGDPPLSFTTPYPLVPIPTSEPLFHFYAPYAEGSQRLTNVPSVRPEDGRVMATTPGIYLFQCTARGNSIVGRLQVHRSMTDWWFGNDSITTALDDGIAHAQPTIYGRFSDDNTPGSIVGTDLVGDITGHGYITLVMAAGDGGKVEVVGDLYQGRLRGKIETGAQPATLVGSALNKSRQIPVNVVDYGKRREILEPVIESSAGVSSAKADPATAPNLLILGDGFTDAGIFDFSNIAVDVYLAMRYKPRHAPFPQLVPRMNVYQAFTRSAQDLLTCGYRVVDNPPADFAGLKGLPIPIENTINSLPATFYRVRQLTHLVGLPKRGETRSADDLTLEWATQRPGDFTATMVDKAIVTAWKTQQPKGILHARDTFFGLQLGRRLADRESDKSPVAHPGTNGGDDALKKFVQRMYQFYNVGDSNLISLDPRRHPPELYVKGNTNPLTSVTRFIGGLAEKGGLERDIGVEWTPDADRLKRSRGLVILIANDSANGATHIENGLGCLTKADELTPIAFDYGTPAADAMRRRTPTATIPHDENRLADVAIHELGHSFNLGDEYEKIPGGPPPLPPQAFQDSFRDNLTKLSHIRLSATGRNFDPDKVKWLGLMRIAVASRVCERWN